MTAVDPSVLRFRDVVAASLAHLEAHRQEINDLNVFPVADGDTGDNMVLTLRSVVDQLDEVLADPDRARHTDREALVRELARAALLGARGNSGVILSQLIRGAAEELIARPGELIRPTLVAAALAGSARRGYDSVRQPVEGTVLTVMREMAGAASHAVAQLDPSQLGGALDENSQAIGLVSVIAEALAAGRRALDEGPELLPALKEAGVVDAGGFGLLVMFAGIIGGLTGGDPPDVGHYAAARIDPAHAHESETYRYCTNFAITGETLDPRRARRELARMGDSIIVVVGDERTLKVHVHTDDPDGAQALFAGLGEISRVDVADMNAQVAARAERAAARDAAEAGGVPGLVIHPDAEASTTALLAVARGAGVRALLAEAGASTLDGGPTMNPSTAELVAAIDALPASQVVLLTGNANVRMAADRAADLADREVVVVPTRSQQASVAVAVEHLGDRTAADDAAVLTEVLEGLRTGGVAPAGREDPEGRFGLGDALGYVEEELVSWAPADRAGEVLRDVLERLGDDRELLTVLAADDAPPVPGDVADLAPPDVELRVEPGGQPAWWWLVAAE